MSWNDSAEAYMPANKLNTTTVMAGNEALPVVMTPTPMPSTLPTQGRKFDTGKLRWSLLPAGVVAKIVEILEIGASKYSENNWKFVANARERYYNATMRHIEAWWGGEKHDQETGKNHLAHALCCLMFLLWLDDKETDETGN